MIPSTLEKITPIRSSKILHKSSVIHPQARFVTEEAVCLIFGISFADIYTVECWRYVVYVHAKGVSKFVSYADFPPIVDVGAPTYQDRVKWRKRWRKTPKNQEKRYAPQWWAEFFTLQFQNAGSEYELQQWRQLLVSVNFAFSPLTLQQLQVVGNEEFRI
ncbi:MAG: hypothetical protein EAZ76_06970 [Nostocales cyanobacterium]|nr:MAG: hypothetical protein EAZ87_07005 [Nostocales cyanobacterium]TAF16683.1 MAG: hypothetical protein EAZ76_06970 [Nostocales cyanobacterium]